MPSYKVTYFDGKGRGESIRIALHAAGIPFIDERLTSDQFLERKENFPFGQLPLLTIDGKAVLPMEVAILKYIGRKAGLYPNDPEEALQADIILGLTDGQPGLCRIVYVEAFFCSFVDLWAKLGSYLTPDFADSVEWRKVIEEATPKLLGYLDKRLAANGTKYSGGDKLTVADIRLYVMLSTCKSGIIPGLPQDLISKYPHITKLYEVIAGHEKVASWNKSQAT